MDISKRLKEDRL